MAHWLQAELFASLVAVNGISQPGQKVDSSTWLKHEICDRRPASIEQQPKSSGGVKQLKDSGMKGE